MKALSTALLVSTCLAGITARCVASTELKFGDPLVYAHVVVRGTVDSVWTEIVPATRWGGYDAGADFDVTVVRARITVAEVLRGNVHDKVLVIAHRARFKVFRKDAHVIVAAYLRPQYADASYVIESMDDVVVQKNDAWIRSSSGMKVNLNETRQAISSTTPEQVTRQSDLVIVGTVLEVTKKTALDGHGRQNPINLYRVRVESVVKGSAEKGELDLVTITQGRYKPNWRTFVPFELEAGETWYMFLRKGPMGYFPVGGERGLLMVSGDKLIYDRSEALPFSRSGLDALVRQEARP